MAPISMQRGGFRLDPLVAGASYYATGCQPALHQPVSRDPQGDAIAGKRTLSELGADTAKWGYLQLRWSLRLAGASDRRFSLLPQRLPPRHSP